MSSHSHKLLCGLQTPKRQSVLTSETRKCGRLSWEGKRNTQRSRIVLAQLIEINYIERQARISFWYSLKCVCYLGKITRHWQVFSPLLLESCKNADFLPTLLCALILMKQVSNENPSLVQCIMNLSSFPFLNVKKYLFC